MKKLLRLMRYDWPLHFFLFLTCWLPDQVFILRLRGWLARPFFGSCGKDLRLGRNVTFYNPSQVHLGKHVYIAFGGWFSADAPIRVGDEVMFGPYCVTTSSNHARSNGSFRYAAVQVQPVTIGAGSWIGAHAVITAGSRIGQGTLIAAGAVVHGEIPDGVMAGGLPAKVIKTLE